MQISCWIWVSRSWTHSTPLQGLQSGNSGKLCSITHTVNLINTSQCYHLFVEHSCYFSTWTDQLLSSKYFIIHDLYTVIKSFQLPIFPDAIKQWAWRKLCLVKIQISQIESLQVCFLTASQCWDVQAVVEKYSFIIHPYATQRPEKHCRPEQQLPAPSAHHANTSWRSPLLEHTCKSPKLLSKAPLESEAFSRSQMSAPLAGGQLICVENRPWHVMCLEVQCKKSSQEHNLRLQKMCKLQL